MGRPPIGRRLKFGQKVLQNPFEVLHDVGVGDPDRSVTKRSQGSITPYVSRGVIMRMTVDLNDQARLRTKEIDDRRTDRSLAPELEAAELAVREAAPQAFFGFCWVATHVRCSLGECGSPPQPLP